MKYYVGNIYSRVANNTLKAITKHLLEVELMNILNNKI